MTDGLNMAGLRDFLNTAPWRDHTIAKNGSSLGEGDGFIKQWKVFKAEKGTDMPIDQTFMFQKVIGPNRTYFQIVPTGPNRGIASDWAQAEFELDGNNLTHTFEAEMTVWTLNLQDQHLHAVGLSTSSSSQEAAGEWDAQEE